MPVEFVHSAAQNVLDNVDLSHLAVKLGIRGGTTAFTSFARPYKSTISKWTFEKFSDGSGYDIQVLVMQGKTGFGIGPAMPTMIWASQDCHLRVKLDTGDYWEIDVRANTVWEKNFVSDTIVSIAFAEYGDANDLLPTGLRVEDRREGAHTEKEVAGVWRQFRHMKDPKDLDEPVPKEKGIWDFITGNW